MEINDNTIQLVSSFLEKSLSPDLPTRRSAEKQMEEMKTHNGYSVILLLIVASDKSSFQVRLQAAVTFKNLAKNHWRVTDDADVIISNQDRDRIKKDVVELMLKSPNQLQDILSDAITYIGREDFPYNWPGLLEDMVAKFRSGDFNIINGVLKTAHSLFKRYRHEMKSNELWKEISFVQNIFALPLTELFDLIMSYREKELNDKDNITTAYSSILFIAKLFYSLSFQECIQVFEENIAKWMNHFLILLTNNCSLLQTNSDVEPGLEELVRGQICEILSLYAAKYDNEDEYDFTKEVPNMVSAVWHLLVTVGNAKKYDLLVSHGIDFLSTVAERATYKKLFEQDNALFTICDKVAVPNMELRECDVDDFHHDGEGYIRFDLEGSDTDTRRKAAADLIRALCHSFEGVLINYVSQTVISAKLQEYAKDPLNNWRHKNVVVYLCSALASRAQTQKEGTTKTSKFIDVTEFYVSQILPDLQNDDLKQNLILKADSLKYLSLFRNQLASHLENAIVLACKMLRCENLVVHTYAAYAIERILLVRKVDRTPVISQQYVSQISSDLITNLFNCLKFDESSENMYVMKSIMRVFSALQENLVQYLSLVVPVLSQKLVEVSKNPRQPHFNHYLFESICLAIRHSCSKKRELIDGFMSCLLPPIGDILINDVQDFIPYCFQVLSLILEYQPDGRQIPEQFMALFPHLLIPELWGRSANIPPLVRLLQAYIERGSSQIPEAKMTNLLGIWQKLLASKSNDNYAFYLLSCLIEHMPSNRMEQYYVTIFTLIFQRLSNSKTTKYSKSLIVFLSLFATLQGADKLIGIIDGLQAKMFARVIENIICVDLQKVSGSANRKICAVGLTSFLTSTSLLDTNKYFTLWPKLLVALIGLFELPEDISTPNDEHFIEVDEPISYQAAFTRLAYAGDKENNPFGHITDVKKNLVESLSRISTKYPGRLSTAINSSLPAEHQQALRSYMQASNVTLS